MTLSVSERDALLARLDERTERTDRTLDDVVKHLGELRVSVGKSETRISSLEQAERRGWIKSLAMSVVSATLGAFGLKVLVGA